ncbi:MAG: hypothetical protein WD906_06365 [Anaerolineales bacterium]
MTSSAPASPAPEPAAGISPAAGCLIAIAVAVIGIAAVFTIASLLARGDLILAKGELTETRIWLIRESTEQGLGFSRSRTVSRDEARTCVETQVGFWLWKTATEPLGATYCACYERAASGWEEMGACAP